MEKLRKNKITFKIILEVMQSKSLLVCAGYAFINLLRGQLH